MFRTLLRHTAQHIDGQTPVEDDLADAVDAARDTGQAVPPLVVGAAPLVQAMVGTNRYIARNHLRQGYFATIFFGVLDPVSGSLIYINGGHNPPVLTRSDGLQTSLHPTGPAVGLLPDSVFSLGQTTVGSGDTLFLYTDGVVEARNTDEQLYGLQRTQDVLTATAPDAAAEDLLDVLDRDLRSFVGTAEQSDDITMLALRHNPATDGLGPRREQTDAIVP